MSNRPPLEALLLTPFQQKIVRRAVRSDFTLFTLDIAAVRQQQCGFVPAVFCLLSYRVPNYSTQNIQ
jgi:hypothetical protein